MEATGAENRKPNPIEDSNFLSKVLFWHAIPLFRKSLRKHFSINDLYRPLQQHRAELLGSKFYGTWEMQARRFKRAKAEKTAERVATRFGILLRCILQVFGPLIAYLGLSLFFLDICFKLTQPIFLGLLVSRYSGSDTETSMYYYAAAVILCSVFNVLFTHTYMLNQFHCGMKVRIALMGTVYRKLLRLSKGALQITSSGAIVNLLTSDVAKIDNSLYGLHQLWLGPVETLIVFVLVYYQIGFSAVAGLIILVLLAPVQIFIGKNMAKLRRQIADYSDVRIRLMKEIVRGAHVIKMYVWEKPFGKLIASAREQEMNFIRRSNFFRAFNLSCMMFTSRIAIFTSLVMYALLGQTVTAEKAFVITAYYNILRQIMMVSFPRGEGCLKLTGLTHQIIKESTKWSISISESQVKIKLEFPPNNLFGIEQLGETLTSLERIQDFMLLEEKDKAQTDRNNETVFQEPIPSMPLLSSNDKDSASGPSLKLTKIKARWSRPDEGFILNEISLSIESGEHVAIIGPVGCGKSSVFQVILGEMPLTSGTVEISNSTLSYAPQEPWIFNGSIQQNILFGQTLNLDRYKNVIEACALTDDLRNLPNGDKTLVGDRGQTLSGGQKSRISLARTIYKKADIYLLDDPLSAVDMQVAKHLVDNCIHEFLQGHIVLLATHQTQSLGKMNRVLVLEEGRIHEIQDRSENESRFKEYPNKPKDEDQHVTVTATVGQSVKSKISTKASAQKLQSTQESYKRKAVGLKLYKQYIQLGGGSVLFALAMVFCAGTQFFASGSDYFLAYWVNYDTDLTVASPEVYLKANQSFWSMDAKNRTMTGNTNGNQMWPIFIFTALTFGTIFVTLIRTGLLFEIATRASQSLHNEMYDGIINATMYFFQTNPAGRIINRVSKDMNMVDDMMPQVIIEVIQIALALIGVIVVVSVVNPWSLLPTMLLGVVFYHLRKVYLASSRNLMRMQGVARSPVYSHVIESLAGLSTIRAFCAEDTLTRIFDSHQDVHSSVYYATLTTGRAFAFSLDSICIFYIIFVIMSSLENCNAGELGLAITQAIGLTGMLQWGVRQSSEMENLMTSVERIVEYVNLEKERNEDARIIASEHTWPEKGAIKFNSVSLRYTPQKDANCVLSSIKFEIHSKEKVGVVGRTGSGKSSLVNALFCLAFTEGVIEIDGQNISRIPLDNLRRRISIIPQDPILFSGSIRHNLDPFKQHSDEEIWYVLETVQLRELVLGLSGGLDKEISEEGSSLSTGEKQLVCLARALLRQNKILIMDEATANVDRKTDRLIQRTIREKCKDCTVIVIAHRLETVMNLDRVAVMENGTLIEYGNPCDLLRNPHSKLFQMANEAGVSTYTKFLQTSSE